MNQTVRLLLGLVVVLGLVAWLVLGASDPAARVANAFDDAQYLEFFEDPTGRRVQINHDAPGYPALVQVIRQGVVGTEEQHQKNLEATAPDITLVFSDGRRVRVSVKRYTSSDPQFSRTTLAADLTGGTVAIDVVPDGAFWSLLATKAAG